MEDSKQEVAAPANDARKATDEQIKRARRMVEGNPRLRWHLLHPMGLAALALHVPLTRREKKDLHLRPNRHRSAAPIAHPKAVEHFLAHSPEAHSAEELIMQMAGSVGYRDPAQVERNSVRVGRWMARHSGPDGGIVDHVPTHIHNKAVLASAAVQAIAIRFPGRLPPESFEAIAALHKEVA